ncbi:hypothetical protein PIGHUM_01265 [Pigmentiphaga humi]|uniref:Uncharacterized protein n=1 Tax=Pigmentiphaga humi TaxID=2478468 RepID=A0A3P4B240_9BURK|nr:hypothetical protein [Pigmentiphaga humi]VCU69205.1 hypothetical protein PIGHUM_01265 [Pigmentiphaga humi]
MSKTEFSQHVGGSPRIEEDDAGKQAYCAPGLVRMGTLKDMTHFNLGPGPDGSSSAS